MRIGPAAVAAFLTAFLPAAAAGESESADQARKTLSAAAGQALQGRASEAAALLSRTSEDQFGAKDRAIRNCIIERFGAGSEAPGPGTEATLTGRAIAAYRTYWWSALTRPDTGAAAEAELEGRLRRLLQLPPGAEWEAIEESLGKGIEAEGYHPLMGRTPPLLELMVWKSESSESRDVPLPEGDHRVTVKLLDGFESLGWSAYATCERSFTGGWVKPDAIYAVRPGWTSLTGENFVVSFVGHETQHFADEARFGELESWELEYRAKLAELALATETLPRLLGAFQSNQGSDPGVPHSYANALVLAQLREKLGDSASSDLAAVDATKINAAALALLVEDSAKRSAKGGIAGN